MEISLGIGMIVMAVAFFASGFHFGRRHARKKVTGETVARDPLRQDEEDEKRQKRRRRYN